MLRGRPSGFGAHGDARLRHACSVESVTHLKPFSFSMRAHQRHCCGGCRAQASRDADRERTRDLVVALDAAIALGNFHGARRALAMLAEALPVARNSRNADGTPRADRRPMRL
jgi:hypothetical protein